MKLPAPAGSARPGFFRGAQAGASPVVAEHAIEAGRILEQLAGLREPSLPPEIEPRRLRLRQIAGGDMVIDLRPFLRREHGPSRPVDAAEAPQIPPRGSRRLAWSARRS